MTEEKKVSIVVPIFNQEHFLDKSIKSIIKQTYQNIEIVLVNDGSTDRSLDIINSYAENDSRIHIISQDNRGLVGAVVTGIENANGEYICFVDPDDLVGSKFVSRFIENIGDEDFIAMGIYMFSMRKKWIQPLYEERTYNKKELQYYSERLYGENNTCDELPRFFHSRVNKLYRTSLLKSILNQYKKCLGVTLGEDAIFTYLVLQKATSGKAMNTVNSYYYRTDNAESMTNNLSPEVFYDKMEIAYKTFCNILDEKQSNKIIALKMYFLFGERLRSDSLKLSNYEYRKVYERLHLDKKYMHVIKKQNTGSKRLLFDNFIWKKVKSPIVYKIFHNVIQIRKTNLIIILLLINVMIFSYLKLKKL